MKQTEFKEQLKKNIQIAFDNETNFIKEFVNEIDDYINLDYLYIASGRCLVGIEAKAFCFSKTIPTSDYLDWVDSISNNLKVHH